MHDGRLATLRDVLDHYENGGSLHPNKSKLITPFKLSKIEKDDLLAFLNTLTDYRFITNKKFSNPYPEN